MSFYNLAMISITEIIGDFSFQKYVDTNNLNFFTMGLAGYACVIYYLIQSLRQATILRINLLWDGLSALTETLAAMIILGQTFEHTSQWVGALMLICGLFLVKFV